MASGFYKAVRKILLSNNYKHIGSGKGFHEKWQCKKTGKITIVPRNLKSRHTANAIVSEITGTKEF